MQLSLTGAVDPIHRTSVIAWEPGQSGIGELLCPSRPAGESIAWEYGQAGFGEILFPSRPAGKSITWEPGQACLGNPWCRSRLPGNPIARLRDRQIGVCSHTMCRWSVTRGVSSVVCSSRAPGRPASAIDCLHSSFMQAKHLKTRPGSARRALTSTPSLGQLIAWEHE